MVRNTSANPRSNGLLICNFDPNESDNEQRYKRDKEEGSSGTDGENKQPVQSGSE